MVHHAERVPVLFDSLRVFPEMEVWILTLWSLAVPPFEGGQYHDLARCERAAREMVIGLRPTYGRLYWRCSHHEL